MSPSPLDSAAARQKGLGAFYTPVAIARELVTWAIRAPSDTVLDPSFGSLAFLEAAEARLGTLGAREAHPGGRLYGIEVDDQAFAAAAARLWSRGASPTLVHQDFLSVQPGELVPAVDVVVGNPPYLRYQGFNAHNACFPGLAAAAASVPLTRLASSWAPFVVHAVRFVAAGGRLAHVLPGQLLHAQYAQPVTEFLGREFHRVAVIAFEERVFPSAQEEVVLVLAEGRGGGPSDLEFFSCRTLAELDVGRLLRGRRQQRCAGERRGKLLAELLDAETRAAYSRAEAIEGVSRLGDIAGVDIGTVTGANSFFLLSREAAEAVHPALLKPVVSRAAHVRSARFTNADYRTLVESGVPCRLLLADDAMPREVIATVEDRILEGEADGLHLRNKCRARNPWWAVRPPRRPIPDLFMTYCAHQHPRIVLNEAGVLNTNTLHGVTVRKRGLARRLAAGFYNSLTMLSAELLARSYGGGVLKLEPTEAEALLIPPLSGWDARRLLSKVDRFIRAGDLEGALNIVDPLVLEEAVGLGFSPAEVAALRRGAERLRRRRHARARDPR
jgi:adenine-specific DNA-methyltransferase